MNDGLRSGTPSWRSWVPTPTIRLAWIVLGAATVALVSPVLAAVLVTLAIGALLTDTVRTIAPHRVAVARELPAIVPLDGTAELTWRIRNPDARPLRVDLADELVPSLNATSRRVSIVIPAVATAATSVSLHPSRRGAFTPTSLTVRVTGPWRLATRQARRDLPGRLEVHPSFRSRREAELRISRRRVLEVGIRSAQGRGGGTEFDRLRDYVPGDEVRRVDWSATARTGRPVVRTYRAERNQQVLMLLDTGRTMAGVIAGVPRLDHAMDAAMALTTVATHLGDRVGLLSYDAEVRGLTPPGRGRDQLRVMTGAMYALEPRLVEADHATAFRTALARYRRRVLLVLFTELADEAVTESLVPALPLVRRDHELIIVSSRDPEVERLERHEPRTAGDAYTAAAAAAAGLRRDHTVQMLRRLGVRVVDEPPGRVAGALADAYLELKATGRL